MLPQPLRIVLIAACSVLIPASGVRGQPTLSFISPGAVRPGETTQVTLHGAKLEGELQCWSSIPTKLELQPAGGDSAEGARRVCRVTVPAEVPAGIAGLVIGSAEGASDPVFFLVDDLPSVAESEGNHSAEKAQAVKLPCAVDGVSDGKEFDYFRFTAQRDQRISVEIVAARMGQPFDGVVRLLDAAGRELLLADDDPSFGADCRFAYTAPADGDYVLEVHDNQYRGGGRYRLRMGDFPLVSAPFPLGGRFGSTMRFQFTGPLAESASPVFLRLPEEVPAGCLPLAAKFPQGQSSGMAMIVASDLPDMVEVEPNNEPAAATLASLPCAVNGTFAQAGDRDYYEFAAAKGDAAEFRAVSRSLGSPTYLVMRLYDAQQKEIASSPVNDADEASVRVTFPADGMYWLCVEDLLNRGGPEYGYRVEVQASGGYSLNLKHDNNARTRWLLPANGGACSLTLQVTRRGYNGPIQLALDGAPAGCVLRDSVIPAKAKEHRVWLEASPSADPGSLLTFRMVGSATIQGRKVREVVQTTPTLRARFPFLAFPPRWLDGLFVASVGKEAPPLFGLTSSANPLVFSRSQGQAQFALSLERTNQEFKDAVPLKLEGLPTGFAAAIKQDKDRYEVTVTGPKDAALGRSEFHVWGFGELKGVGRIIEVCLPLEITD